MALLEGCKHSLEISVPVEEVETETGKVVSTFQAKAKLPGFRPGKAPASLIRKQFQADIRQQVLENLIPKFLQKRVEEEELRVALVDGQKLYDKWFMQKIPPKGLNLNAPISAELKNVFAKPSDSPDPDSYKAM